MTDGRPIPTGLFEWQRLVRRIRMSGTDKLAALVLATYADPDGSRVRPGNDVLAAVLGQTERNVKRIMSRLRDQQLIVVTRRGGGKGGAGRATVYQLTIPPDFLDRFTLLDPDDRPDLVSGDIQMSPQTDKSPVDNSESTVDNSPPIVDNPAANAPNLAAPGVNEGTFGPIEGTSGCPTTTHIYQPPTTKDLVVATQRESRPRARSREPPTRSPIRPQQTLPRGPNRDHHPRRCRIRGQDQTRDAGTADRPSWAWAAMSERRPGHGPPC